MHNLCPYIFDGGTSIIIVFPFLEGGVLVNISSSSSPSSLISIVINKRITTFSYRTQKVLFDFQLCLR